MSKRLKRTLIWGYIAPGVKVSALDIYGTKTPLTAVYAAAGGVCLMLSLLSALHPRRA